MARAISADALDIIASGARYTERCIVTVPDGDPVELETSSKDAWSVTERGPIAGPRLGVSGLTLLRKDYTGDLFELAGYAGAVVKLQAGITMGASIEWLDLFTGYMVEGSSRRDETGISVTLTDGWGFADKVPIGDFATTVGTTRATALVELVAAAINDVDSDIRDNGGYFTAANVYTDSRASAATDIATDGLLQTGFNGSGALVVKAQPNVEGNLSANWIFRTDQSDTLALPAPPSAPATIVTDSLERTRPWLDALYNAVVVKPGGPEQTWTEQTVRLAKTCDPRHEDKVGFRPLYLTSDTITNACDAFKLAAATLTRLLRGTEEGVKVDVVFNPAVEADDIFWAAAMPTLDDTGWNSTYIARSVTHSPSAAITSIEGVSALSYELEAV